MSKKGVYSYDYIDSFEKFIKTKLPLKKNFTAFSMMEIFQTTITRLLKKFGKVSSSRIWVNIMIDI